jgi:hypothetical protein
MAIHLGRSLPSASCDPPERRRGDPLGSPDFRATCRSYSVLLPVGFSLPPPSPAARCALTAPFHPCRNNTQRAAAVLVSVALSLGVNPPDVIRHRMSMEPGLSSHTAFRHWHERSSGRLTH